MKTFFWSLAFLKESIDNNERMCEADLIKEENFEYLQFTTERMYSNYKII